MKYRGFSIIVFILFLHGCAGTGSAQQQAQAKRYIQFEQVLETRNSSCERRYLASPETKILSKKIPYFWEDIAFEHMTNNTTPTDTERESILVLANLFQECNESISNVFERYSDVVDRRFGLIYYTYNEKEIADMSSLYNREITYGEFNRKRKDLDNQTSSEFEKIRSSIEERDRQAQQQESAASNSAGSRTVQCKKFGDLSGRVHTFSGGFCPPGYY